MKKNYTSGKQVYRKIEQVEGGNMRKNTHSKRKVPKKLESYFITLKKTRLLKT
ncbi:hypothetical protein RU98_GL002888 [Enterococcus caccae]|nr:hypothetical protein RU98_GL002888 [Enterococcus caccae]